MQSVGAVADCFILLFTGGPSLCPEEKPHPITGETVPLTFGHEFSGIIEEVGEGVSDRFKVGSRVVVAPIIFDGDCGACQEGLVNCCWQNGFIGLSGGGGMRSHPSIPVLLLTLIVLFQAGFRSTWSSLSMRFTTAPTTSDWIPQLL